HGSARHRPSSASLMVFERSCLGRPGIRIKGKRSTLELAAEGRGAASRAIPENGKGNSTGFFAPTSALLGRAQRVCLDEFGGFHAQDEGIGLQSGIHPAHRCLGLGTEGGWQV